MNFPASVVSQFPSCTKSVTVRLEGTTIRLKQKREVTVNGVEVKDLPTWVNGAYIKKASSIFVMVELDNGLDVWWDGQTSVYVDAPSDFRGQVSGLCGTFTDNQRDDFLTPEGDVENNAVAFANKWKTSERCPDQPLAEEGRPCDRHVQNKAVAEKYCAKVKSSLFAKCHLEVDPEPYYRDCLYDMCSCETKLDGCLCPTLASYAKECTRKGILIDWRAEVRECGVHCTGGQKYQVCGNSCTHTCLDIATNPNCKRKCVEGCNCPEGFSLDQDGICVPITECPCVYQAKEYKPGYEMLQQQTDGKDMVCECFNAGWNCWEPRDNDTVTKPPQVQCPEHLHEIYTDCMPEEENTCQTMHLRSIPGDLCRAGCICGPGYVRNTDTGSCIKHSQCPCHHGGRSYSEGDIIVEDCNTCECEGGQWVCTEEQCPGICSAWGESHYKTFDGRMFEFHGTCDYLLAKGKSPRSDSFEVTVQNVPCGTNGVTCAKSVTLRVGSGNSQEIVEFSRNKPTPTKNLTRTIIREAGVFVFAEVSDMGLVLQWDRGTRAYLRLDPSWKGKVRGLCGNYNDDEQDDFKTPSGGSSEVSVRIFGDSWRLQNYCPDSVIIKDTCSLHPHRKVWASEQCAVLKTDTFAPCHSEVPVEPYLERCQFDACGCDTGGDCHCLCTAVAAYAHECNIHGVYIAWRTPDFCPMQCDVECEHYESCIPTCPHETCDTLLDPSSPLCVQDACVEGCAKDVCPPGHVYKSATDIECVPKADCEKKCLEIDGEVYLEGDIISEDDCHTCICTRKKKICRGTPCAPTTTPIPLTPSPTPRISTPLPPIPGITPEEGDCRSGWSEFMSDDHPVIFRKNSDVERIPAKIKKSKSGHAFCERSQVTDISCRSVGTHRPHTEQRGVTCSLPEGLLCRGRDDAQADDACRNYEVAVYCNCSIATTEAPAITTPVSPVTPPIISTPAVPPVTAPTPMTCEEEGWSKWYNLHYPDSTGEFEAVTEIRKLHGICPDHYISEVECRPVRGGSLEDVVTCDTQGARCRNSGGQRYCQDYEIRVRCECDCQDGLGMEDWRIPNESITASSTMKPDDAPHSARLFADWAWTAQKVDPNDQQAIQNEWLQVDLGEVKEVTGVTTQGHPLFDYYVERFAVQFSETGLQWDSVKEKDTSYALQFTGNTDSNTAVTNLFPEPVFARYIRIIPLQFYQSISLRLELKGCDVKETTTPAWPVPETTTPIPVCEDGWTEWMNTHTPSPGNWDDLDDLTSLSAKYSFCEPQYIVKTDCRVVGLNQPFELAGQTGVICNINNGLQCNDDLQAPMHCYDYEIRFLCDCSHITTFTTEELPFPSPGVTTPGPIFTLPPSREECTFLDPQIRAHDTDCRKFYECAPTIYGNMEYVEKECGLGTFFHPKSQVCDFEANVARVRPECKTPPPKIVVSTAEPTTRPPTTPTTTPEPCTGHFWTEWFNVSHPDVENGDFETFEKIRELGYDICPDMYIMDIECQYNQITEVTTGGGGVKGGTKGGRKSKKGGRRGPPEVRITPSAYTTSRDVQVTCSRDTGLTCFNSHQRFRARCEDYAIRVLCSCMSTQPTPAPAISTTPYIDVRESTVITTPPTATYVCPPGTRYQPNAISCNRVCLYYQFILQQTGECLREGDFAPACVNISSPVACPGNQYLRDKSTCVDIQDCNCRLPNGMAAPPGRVFRVDECEVCQCSNNYLMCDSSACVLTALPSIKITEEPSFECNNWTSWISGSSPVDGNESELLKDLGLKYPKLCRYPPKVECRVKDTKESALTAGQNIDCRPFYGLTCKKDLNPEGCKDYEVRFWCDCSDIDFSHGGELTESTTLPTTTYTASHLTNVTTTWRPYMDSCTDDKTPVKCALPCDRVCMYYKQVLRQNGFCELDGDCAPGCLEEKQSLMCPPGFYMLDSNRCVAVADCSCRLANGLTLPAGVWHDVSPCERCMCQNNNLLCEREPGCLEISTIEPTVFTEKEVTIEITPRPKISFQCNNWSPYFKKQKTSEGVIISLDTVKEHIDFPCEIPTNASCREAAAKLPASSLGQVLTCDPLDGLQCLDLENSKDCHDYEISFFCECEEESTIAPPETTLGPVVTLAPCDAWSPWINEFKPWHSDFEIEYKSLQQLRDQYGFCMEGQLAAIECVEAATGQSVASDKGTSCDVRYGFSCKNADQDRGQCLDYKIRYYCTCETTTVITTTFVPPTITLPSVCDPDKYIHLLKDVDDSALSSTRARNTYFGPSNARLYNADGSLNSKSWGPLINDKNQYLQIDLGSVEPLYGLEMGGNPTTRERVTAYMVQVSDDGTTWSYVPSNPDDPNSKPEEFRGPVSPTAPLKQMFKTPVEARYIRIKPTVWVRSIALRVEVIGCELPTVPTYPITLKPECEEPMGLENGEMSLQQITVSSVLNDDFYFYGKQNLPINAQPGKYTVGGAWVAQPKPEQFVRFDFLEPSKLSGVITQGRSDTDEWVESFKIRYSQDGKTWSTLQEPDGTDKVFPANYDRNTPVETKFDQMIQARYLEIRPETWKSNIAMRAEVLGCFHPYPEITTTPLPEFTTTFPPPPECTPCPGLPEEFYDRCETCTPGTYFDGQTCVPKPICPCYKDGNRYDIGSVFETVDCLECECLVGGQAECKEKTCDPCNDIDQGVLTTSCGCICKPCLEGTRLCPSINYCLNETSWCNGVVECPEDELDCPSTTPVIPLPCPTPYCPEFWQLTVRPSAGPCPIVKCEPPAKTTPMPCPIPFCPPLYDISLIPKKGNEMCPKYECIPPSTTMAPPECPPLLCPDGYEVQTSDDVVPEMPFGECPQYQCVTAAPPTAPCPPPTCPQGYDIFFADSKAILELCPPYDCIPIVTTTMCPPVECGEGLRTMYIQAPEGSACPQYTCVQVTTPTAITTEPPVTCPPMELPICKAGEELYQTNPNELCPRFGCKPFGMTPTPFPEAPRNITPTCTIEGRSFDSFDDSHYQVEPCNHILAEDKINKDWIITMHRNCSYSNSCDRYLKITQDDQQLILKPDLLIVWDENSYTVSQAQRIGTSRNAFTVSRVGDSIRFSSSVYKYSVEWNTEMNVRIEVGTELTNQVDGLCGFYTGYAHDDKTKPDGKLATTNKEYGQSWALDDQPCEEKPKCTVVQSAESFQLCEAIKNDPFTKCHSAVDPSSFLKGCVATTCDCLREGKDVEECRCQALTHYVTRCLESDSQMKLDDWRIVAKCYKECGPGERYQDCFRATCEKSCENLHDDKACMEREGACVPGCFCSPGLVRKGDRCVNPEKCGDCVCEGYGDPHYQTFDRQNYTFNGECSYVAARDKNVRGQHAFEVITRNKKCTIQPVTVCTDAVTVLFKDHTVFIENEGDSIVTVTVDGVDIPTFPHREPWLALEQPDAKQIMAAIPEIQLEVRYFLENFGFSVKVPSRLYFNKTEGLCGNCNYRTEDEFEARGTGLVESSDDFGMSWLLDNEPSSCGVIEKETTSCIPLPPDVDPCLRIMDEEIFGKCHPVEDPVPYVSSCQLDACGSREPEVAGCHSLEAYARRCAELDICLNWRSDVLCPKICPESLVFNPCGPGCVRTCENYQELNENPDACPISSVDGCFCPEGMVLDNGTCINETFCTACDDEGHRIGDVWQTDPCTTCECSIRGSSCSTKTCPDEPICDEGYEVVEVPDTGDACCGPRKKCRVIPVKDCPPTIEPKDECGYGQKHKVIEAPGVCPQYACVCVEPEECPALEVPDDDKLKPGEVWNLDDTGCCIRYKAECTDVCPEVECPEFYEPVEKPLQAGQCCPDVSCEPPSDACIYENIYVVDENGFQKTAEQPSGVKKGGRPQTSEPEKKLYKVGEKWDDGLCLKCSCSLDSTGKPRHMCTEQTCPTVDTHPDKDEFQLDSLQVPGQCCPDIVRTACIDDYEVIEIGERLDDPLNGCRSVECLRHPDGKVDKVEQIHTCDENCPLGWVYEPSPLYPHQCCGECVQVACVVEGEVKEVGDIWVSDDYCTTFTCAKENNRQIQIQAVEVKCTEPSAKDRQDYEYFETLVPGQCCPTYSRTSCLMDDIPIAAGDSVQDPLNNCLTVSCEKDKDGNVTRREKEITCDADCALGQTYIEPIEGSNECCGKCLVTHCMDGGVAYSIGERWESEGDACYEYRCETRDMVLTTVAVKKDCPYFDPECPPEEIYMDDNGCCQLCNVTRPVKSDCKPTPMSLEETVGIFTLTARGVGTCKNTEPVVGFNQCYGHCDSYTQFVGQGRRGGYVSTCFCCKPAKFQKIRVDMRCETGYAFTRVYDNIVECECLRCDDGAPEYLGDEPILDDVDFFAMTEEPLDE